MMKEKKDFINLLDDLCDIYKDYVKNNDDSRLEVIIQDNMIDIYLYDNMDVIDEFGLFFEHREKDKYRYVSVVLMKLLFGSKVICSKDNVFYENIDGTGFKIIVNDDDLFNRMFDMACIHRDNDFYDRIDKGRRIRNRINKNKDLEIMDARVDICRTLIRTRSMNK